jgi:hypothetical protein
MIVTHITLILVWQQIPFEREKWFFAVGGCMFVFYLLTWLVFVLGDKDFFKTKDELDVEKEEYRVAKGMYQKALNEFGNEYLKKQAPIQNK